jgi:hypothetical protein
MDWHPATSVQASYAGGRNDSRHVEQYWGEMALDGERECFVNDWASGK